MYVIGIDEAGKGPVIGPLMLCAFAMEEQAEPQLRAIGVRDSKLLQGRAREQIASKIMKFPHRVLEVSAAEITRYMRRRVSFNDMEAEKAAHMLKALVAEIGADRVVKVLVDSPDYPPKKFEMRIRKHLVGKQFGNLQIISENKADYKYVAVGAASILAKSARERRIAEIRKELQADFGSGYPSDPSTIDYLRLRHKDAKLQKYIRHEWKTMDKLKMTDMKLDDFI